MTAARSVIDRLQGRPETAAARFWAKVRVDASSDDACWEWDGTCNDNGYGQFDKVGAHRVAYWLATGEDPGERDVLHRCDNPPCVRPSHLFLGTHAENMADAVSKSRMPGRRSLTDAEVAELRALYREGLSGRALAVRFGISQQQANRLASGASRVEGAVVPAWRTAGYATPHSKLTVTQEQDVRDAYAAGGTSLRKLAARYGVSMAVVQRILRGGRQCA